jgi:hypothetical protein
MEAEAQKLIPILFSKCGDEYFSKQTFKHRAGMPYVIRQYKGLIPIVKTHALTKRYQKNVEWKGDIRFSATKGREFPHGEQFVLGGRRAAAPDTWTEWRNPNLAGYMFLVEKKNGVISVQRRTSMEITPVPCSEVPKG